VVVATLFVAGCGVTVTTHPLNRPPKAMLPHPVSVVGVYTASKPRERYVEVAMIEVRQESVYSGSEREVFREMRRKAAAMGCDGLILLGAADAIAGGGVWNPLTGTQPTVATLHGYRGTCIVMDDAGDNEDDGDQPVRPAPKARPSTARVAPADSCEPPCSPGYVCEAGACLAQCNPPCAADEVCEGDRVCRAR
jgi:hypothetical protein